eukprot:354993-Chlamydomonas_euryale.AAC.5
MTLSLAALPTTLRCFLSRNKLGSHVRTSTAPHVSPTCPTYSACDRPGPTPPDLSFALALLEPATGPFNESPPPTPHDRFVPAHSDLPLPSPRRPHLPAEEAKQRERFCVCRMPRRMQQHSQHVARRRRHLQQYLPPVRLRRRCAGRHRSSGRLECRDSAVRERRWRQSQAPPSVAVERTQQPTRNRQRRAPHRRTARLAAAAAAAAHLATSASHLATTTAAVAAADAHVHKASGDERQGQQRRQRARSVAKRWRAQQPAPRTQRGPRLMRSQLHTRTSLAHQCARGLHKCWGRVLRGRKPNVAILAARRLLWRRDQLRNQAAAAAVLRPHVRLCRLHPLCEHPIDAAAFHLAPVGERAEVGDHRLHIGARRGVSARQKLVQPSEAPALGQVIPCTERGMTHGREAWARASETVCV